MNWTTGQCVVHLQLQLSNLQLLCSFKKACALFSAFFHPAGELPPQTGIQMLLDVIRQSVYCLIYGNLLVI